MGAIPGSRPWTVRVSLQRQVERMPAVADAQVDARQLALPQPGRFPVRTCPGFL